MLPVQVHPFLIFSQYLARARQANNHSHSVVTSPRISETRKILQSRFLHRIPLYLSNSVLPTSNYGTIIKSLHTETVSNFKSLLTRNRVLQTALPQIAEEANLPRPYRTTRFHLRSSFCSSLDSYHERIELIPISLPSMFLVLLTSNTLDRDRPVGMSVHDVGVSV